MDRKILLLLPLFLILGLAACQAQPTPAPTGLPRFEAADCPFTKPAGQDVQCGYLVVPESRPVAASPRTIRLMTAIFSSASSPAPDPIIYLEGGPGGSTLRSMLEQFELIFPPFLAQRDLILFDQRGTGYSQPALDCPEVAQAALEMLPLNLKPEESEQRSNTAYAACRDRLQKEGVNLAAYNSAQNAADLNDLRLALGLKEWNLYGISYGTRLALTVLRDFPQGVRSVVIDSVVPLQADNSSGVVLENASRDFTLLFETCAADPACSAAYPNLKQVFYDTVKKLNDQPVKVKITLPDLGLAAKKGQQVEALINGDALTGTIFQIMYSTSILPSVPQIIYMTSQGNYGPIANLTGQIMSMYHDVSFGMNTSFNCTEEQPFTDPTAEAASFKAHPEIASAFGAPGSDAALCKLWGVPSAAALENQPVKSDVPTLVLSGQLDPITPPAWGKLAASTLSKSTFLEVPAAGHGSSLTELCPRRLVLSFFDDPSSAPNSACLQKDMKLAFAVPVQKMEVELAPFSSLLLNLSGLAPANWITNPSVPGFYSPTGQLTDNTQLFIERLPQTADQFLASLQENLQSQNVTLAPTGKPRTTPTLTFSFYRGQAGGGLVELDVAIAEREGQSFVVMLQSQVGERDALQQAVFLPVIDALKTSR